MKISAMIDKLVRQQIHRSHVAILLLLTGIALPKKLDNWMGSSACESLQRALSAADTVDGAC